ncbi:MAG: hypothetical protein EOP56_07780 [Sphingobacteriales bacterium]|nr:MAG: hypothetical protein EOP56_07780 [Sphingobacteriales bacterium]
MITLTDVLHKIQATVGPDIPANHLNALYRHYASITDQLEETEAYYHKKYGSGTSLYFPLASYEHGIDLIREVYIQTSGTHPKELDTRKAPAQHEKLYLFLYLQPMDTHD